MTQRPKGLSALVHLRALHYLRVARGATVAGYIRLHGGEVGRGLLVDRGFDLRQAPHSGWRLGDNVYLGQNVILDGWPGARFTVGSQAKVLHAVAIGVAEAVSLGSRSQVSEYSSVRNADHDVRGLGDMLETPLISAPIMAGDDAWVGHSSAVLAGSDADTAAVVGANSVVRGALPAGSVSVGAPASVKRFLTDPPNGGR